MRRGAKQNVKWIRKLLITLCIGAFLLACLPGCYALNFDAEEAYQSIFVIYSGSAMGSGFALGENCVITNAHVISDRSDVTICTYDGEQYTAYVAAMDESLDIAVLVVPGVSFVPLRVADLDKLSVGDDVCAIGAPNSLSYTLTKGVVSSKNRTIGSQHFIQTDAAINKGNSGGPLLNDAGEVVGVNTYKMSDAEGIGLAIPIDVVVAFMEKNGFPLDDGGNVSQALPEPSAVPAVTPAPTVQQSEQTRSSPLVPLILAGVLTISLIGNAILAVSLSRARKKIAALRYDPTERTDFDIEFMD